ncbi:MAG: xanthine dehydrogenase family protein subunit M [Candidatus Aminicenantes bacterium]|nr:MAG: xanthine dehydrogenase family protein subunit M [Candidatus Aminicenantes bacterium]
MIHNFNYHRATTVQESLSLLEKFKEDYKIICGGQSLLILMRQGLVAPENLVDIKSVKEMSYIDYDPKKGLKIGAATTHREIEKSPEIKKNYPVLVEMEENLASVQTRNWGTIGGNLAHGDPASDPAPILIAMTATVKLANTNGERSLLLEDFFVDIFETALEEGELLIEIQVPVPLKKSAVAYEKFNIIKNHQGIVSVAASITMAEDGIGCKDARIVLGAAAATPLRAGEAEQMLIGKKIDTKLLASVGKKASEECDPVSDIHATETYRRALVKALTIKIMKKAWEQAKTSGRVGGKHT